MTQNKTRATRGHPGSQADAPADDAELRVLKKYPNRRLYDTRTSGYITLADVKRMVLEHENFVVRDAKTGEDLTRSILLQIILEEEAGGVPMLSTEMLAQMIRLYGHTMQGMMAGYLEKNIQAFVEMQHRVAEQVSKMGGQATPELWSKVMSMQAPMMQGLMTNYLDQSKTVLAQMQERMLKQTESMFPPGFGLGAKK